LGSEIPIAPRQESIQPYVVAQNASLDDIETARRIVSDAIAEMTKLNKARLAAPSRNNYKLKPGSKVSKRNDEVLSPPLLTITDQIAQAAALVAEVDAKNTSNTGANDPVEKRAGTFWMESIAHKGTVPWGDDSSYKVSRLSLGFINFRQYHI
jgi:hypothetical protein